MHLGRHTTLGHKDLILHIVVVLLIALHLLHVTGIVFVVIERGHRAQFFEAHGQHALRVHIGEAQRTNNLLHSLLATIVLDCFQQGTTHLDIVDKVEPAKAHGRTIPLLIIAMVDDGSHTAHHLAIAIGEEILYIAKLTGGILLA